MRIHKEFPGGNIRVNRVDGDDVYLEQEIRDTTEWWFYWAFAVEGAAGRTLVFHFENRDVLGYWGPCVSRDDRTYAWAGAETLRDRHTFAYAFGAREDRVYFRYAFPYQLSQFESWLRAQRGPVVCRTLCASERGRDVPYLTVGDPGAPRSIYFTSRHHACESVGTHALFGAIDWSLQNLGRLKALDCNLVAVPFVDLDGVEDGDQGKARAPHDQNRDYTDEPIYAAVRAMSGLAERHPPLAQIDFHDPWYLGNENDHLYLVKGNPQAYAAMDRYGARLAQIVRQDGRADTIPYDGSHDLHAGQKWLPAVPTPTTSTAFFARRGARIALTVEIPYFGATVAVTPANAHRLGGQMAEALMDFLDQ